MNRIQAELYALTHRGNAGDLEHYAAASRGRERILELGCGAGRLLAALASSARHVVGVEIDPGLRTLARERIADLGPGVAARVGVVGGDMRSFELAPPPFDLILIPYSALFCLLDDDDVRSCLARCRAQLAAGGELMLDAYAVHREDLVPETRADDPGEDHQECVAVIEHAGSKVTVLERSSWIPEVQRLDVEYTYVAAGASPPWTRTQLIAHRYLFADQLDRCLESAGFSRIERAGDFDGSPFTLDSRLQVVSARP